VQRITGNRSVALQRRPGRGGTLIALPTYAIGHQKHEYMKELP
jgi:hypothetical protein